MKRNLKILGIDPGTATTGFGVIRLKGKEPELVVHGCIKTRAKIALSKRLVIIGRDLEKLIKQYRPDAAAVEDLFFFKNQKTAIAVGQARGVILLTLARHKVPIAEYTPLQVKQTTTSYGRADKKQVQQMVKALLNLKRIPKPDDAADALAIALCHAHHLY